MKKIREDYIGNVYKNKTTHGLKRGIIDKHLNRFLPPSFSSFCGIWLTNEPVPHNTNLTDNGRALLAGAITCKRCRSILNLSIEHVEEPDYYLILDIDDYPIVARKTLGEIKIVLHDLIDKEGAKYVETDCRIVGIKEVEQFSFKIIPKGYDIVLHKKEG